MKTSIESVIAALDQLNVKHYADRGSNAVLLPYRTPWGDLHVVVRLESDDEFLSIASQMSERSPDDPGLSRLIAEQNFIHRLVQIAAKGGQVTASTGLWLIDTKLTAATLERYLHNFIAVTAKCFSEIRGAIAGRSELSRPIVPTERAA